MRALSLCSGYGGLDMAIEAVFGAEIIAHADNEPGPSRVLETRWPRVPNLGDITAVDWGRFDHVDIIGGGTPCQDLSHAGNGAGMREGTRSGIWLSMFEAIAELRPRIVIWENVRGALSACAHSDLEPCPGCMGNGRHRPILRAAGRVLGDLAAIGYDAKWRIAAASDIGAPHRRERLFIVARDASEPRSARPQSEWAIRPGQTQPAARNRAAAHPHGGGCVGGPYEPQRGPLGGVAASRRGEIDWREYEPAIRRWENVLGREAPSPTEPGPKGRLRLSALFVEWLMGLPEGWVTAVPGLTRRQQIEMLGNGVVPQQAGAAIASLMEPA